VSHLEAPELGPVEDRPEPTVQSPTDAIVRLAATCIWGSDLWPYRGTDNFDQPVPFGHEYAGRTPIGTTHF
jgi:threonine dehydrogenase-like Zn-dependent dehydrogenase